MPRMVNNCLPMQKTQQIQVWSLCWKDLLEEEIKICFSILAWKIPWIEEPVTLQSMASQRVRHNWVTEHAHAIPVLDIVNITAKLLLRDRDIHNGKSTSITRKCHNYVASNIAPKYVRKKLIKIKINMKTHNSSTTLYHVYFSI